MTDLKQLNGQIPILGEPNKQVLLLEQTKARAARGELESILVLTLDKGTLAYMATIEGGVNSPIIATMIIGAMEQTVFSLQQFAAMMKAGAVPQPMPPPPRS